MNERPGVSPGKRDDMKNQAVIVRAYSGVFFGYLAGKPGSSVDLLKARQIWSWGSAGLPDKSNTCGDIAERGLGSDSKVSAPVTRVHITQVGAIFYVSKTAEKIVNAQKWGSR